MVLIHGALLTADDMVLALMNGLSQRYDVVAFDRPGHGGSAQTQGNPGSPYAQAAQLAAGWTALGIERPILLGHSFGGAVAISAAIDRPDAIGGVVALAPICFPEIRVEQVLLGPRAVPFAGAMRAHTEGRLADIAILPLLRNAMFLPQAMPHAYAESFPFAWASTPAMMIADGKDSLGIFALVRSAVSYPRCRVPTRIVGGTHDVVVANARHGYAAAWMMPNAAFEWIPGAGHMIHHFHQGLIERAVERLSRLCP